MKKCVVVVCIILILIVFYCVMFSKHKNNYENDYFHQINALIKDANFNTAKINDYRIILYNLENEQIDEIVFEMYNDDIRINYIRKEQSIIYFVIESNVDDERGIMFVNDDSNKMMDGIKSAIRIGGNSYWYNTAE